MDSAMDYVKGATEQAANVMSMDSMPCTSAQAMLPVTTQNIARSSAAMLPSEAVQSSAILSAMLGVFIIAAAAAYLLFARLETQEAQRRAALSGHTRMPAGFRKSPWPMQKPLSTPEGKAGRAGGSSAPETPEQVFTPKQDRHGSRSLDEEGDYEAASVASVPAQSPTAQGAAAAAARVPIKEDHDDGEAHHRWADGSEYFGEWHGGQPNGRGIFVWPSGARYEGEWRDGQEHGVGTLVEKDGSAYYGFWSKGALHGEGVYKPTSADVIIMRDFVHGQKVKEATLRYGQVDVHKKEVKDKTSKAAQKQDKKAAAKENAKPARPGETIYKGHHSYDLMRNLQLGIIFSIAKSVEQASGGGLRSPVADEDFAQQVTQYFPRGEQNTSFKWKDYCPAIFSRLRDAFGIDNKDYLLSLAGDKALREMPSPGKSGSVFFLSDDDRFLIKTVSHEEMLLLLKLIPAYYRHCADNSTTLLTRFFGVHRVKPLGSQSKVRFVVMGNVFPTEVRLHRKYDLKGSLHGRTAGVRKFTEPDTILKDLDVDMRLALAKGAYGALMRQIEADAALLARMGVMDYSLLLGVHYPKWGDDTWLPPGQANLDKDNREQQEQEIEDKAASSGTVEITSTPDKTEVNIGDRRHNNHGKRSSPEVDAEAYAARIPSAGTSNTANGAKGGEERQHANHGSHSSSSQGAEASHGAMGVERERHAEPPRQALQGEPRRSERGEGTPTSARRAARRADETSPWVQFDHGASSRAMQSPFQEASSQGFDGLSPGKTGFSEANGHSRVSAERPDYSSFAQQKRSSVELGMGNISHAANIYPGAGGGGLRAGRMMSLHSALRAQLGVAVPAMSIAKEGSLDPEPCLLFFGIVDFLQQYNLRKKSEHAFKSLVLNSKLISVMDPDSYAERFCKSARDLFVARGMDIDIKNKIKPKS
ncbi:hypothetical protein CVIRNUC_001300 [Coccomyxa viridis]|uniref:1-phosphatidylinositol-4-phosphate 5-kinase n=1 Tax=Coccomyxa viridis TaxID=1274662 RepID=A0AAV1HU20_9CHLO|nr:hypothetical protein CVIRNUC_001300 [Coccomyxa viridis]